MGTLSLSRSWLGGFYTVVFPSRVLSDPLHEFPLFLYSIIESIWRLLSFYLLLIDLLHFLQGLRNPLEGFYRWTFPFALNFTGRRSNHNVSRLPFDVYCFHSIWCGRVSMYRIPNMFEKFLRPQGTFSLICHRYRLKVVISNEVLWNLDCWCVITVSVL